MVLRDDNRCRFQPFHQKEHQEAAERLSRRERTTATLINHTISKSIVAGAKADLYPLQLEPEKE